MSGTLEWSGFRWNRTSSSHDFPTPERYGRYGGSLAECKPEGFNSMLKSRPHWPRALELCNLAFGLKKKAGVFYGVCSKQAFGSWRCSLPEFGPLGWQLRLHRLSLTPSTFFWLGRCWAILVRMLPNMALIIGGVCVPFQPSLLSEFGECV